MEEKKKEPSDPSKENESEKKRSSTSVGSPLLVVLEFLEALSNVASDSRILINADAGSTVGGATVKYCLLDPASQFSELVRECRSVVVAGGTMQPVAEFEEQLFARGGAGKDRIVSFSCGHVVPKENLMPVVLANGPSGRKRNF